MAFKENGFLYPNWPGSTILFLGHSGAGSGCLCEIS